MQTQYQLDEVMFGLNMITRAAKGITCELLTMLEDGKTLIDPSASETKRIRLTHPEYTADSNGNRLIPGDRYIVATCENGYRYYINVSANSLMTIAAEALRYLQYK